MVEGLEVVIKYRGAKYHKVASPATSSAEFAILKKDLAHLRVHSPSQKNVRRLSGSFILHWPTAGPSLNSKVEGLTDSLHTRWFKLCSDDPEARKLRQFLSIESIRLTQNGVLICSTAGAEQDSDDPLVHRRQPPSMPVPPTLPLPAKPLPPPRPPKLPSNSQSKFEREQPPHLKRRLSSSTDGAPSPAVTRQKVDSSESQSTSPLTPPQSINTQLQPTQVLTSPSADGPRGPSIPGDTTKAPPELTREDGTSSIHALTPTQTIAPSPLREPGEMTPLPFPTPVSGPPSSGPGPASASSLRPPPPHYPHPSSHRRSSSSGTGDSQTPHRRDPDVSRLMRELWDTRRQLTAMQAREQVILNDLGRLGERPDGADSVSRDDVLRLEAELRAERARRVRAEQSLSDVERECRAPFVVPALFQAFISISELSK